MEATTTFWYVVAEFPISSLTCGLTAGFCRSESTRLYRRLYPTILAGNYKIFPFHSPFLRIRLLIVLARQSKPFPVSLNRERTLTSTAVKTIEAPPRPQAAS
jgi:hypothetical protein